MTMEDKKMVFGYELDAFSRYGLAIPIKLGLASHCHALITGGSGSGKSYALLFLIGKLLQACPGISIYLCDFKNSGDFSFLEGCAHYYAGQDCYAGVMDYYREFSHARADRALQGRTRHVLIFDEYPAFVSYHQMKDKMDKTKLANDILGAVAENLMLGRGIGFGCWIVTQRADSTLFSNGARDNFMAVCALGSLSKEQKGMVFPGQEIPGRAFQAGEGMLLADGREITAVKYPLLEDAAGWKRHILGTLAGGSGTGAPARGAASEIWMPGHP